MKYRTLKEDELLGLEEEFKQFLIVNGIHNDEWVKMNQEETDKAVELVNIFSDTVLQTVYEKIKFIEHRSEEACMVFQFTSQEIVLIGLSRKGDSKVNFSTPESIHEALINDAGAIRFYKTKKKFNKTREEDIHEMLEQGCVLSSELFWNALENAISEVK
jgi:hypothetical protein